MPDAMAYYRFGTHSVGILVILYYQHKKRNYIPDSRHVSLAV